MSQKVGKAEAHTKNNPNKSKIHSDFIKCPRILHSSLQWFQKWIGKPNYEWRRPNRLKRFEWSACKGVRISFLICIGTKV